jgi:primosomal protein N' (replication factor Y)
VSGAPEGATFAEVAVPVPLPRPLTYRLPAELSAFARPGQRVRVPVGRRTLTGVLWRLVSAAPDGVEVRDVAALADLEPVLTPELLELARFASEYYLAPLGETVAAMLPQDLPSWGEARVALTDRGALAPARDETERELHSLLLSRGRIRLAELRRALPAADLAERIERLTAEGRLSVEGPGHRGSRYAAAVDLAPGDPAELLERCGRSRAGRAVVEHLRSAARPATVDELRAATGASAAVVRRLVSLGVLLRFSQPERLSLSRHLLPPAPDAGSTPVVLRPDQREALEALRQGIEGGTFRRFLLEGVTGSGKTEVYLRAAGEALERGRSVLLLVPEIALVPALARTAEGRFGNRLAVLHSGLGAAERQQEWERIRRGEARIVVGPRSAVFAPLSDLGLVVVDEEQDLAYKQETSPRYHGRDLALVRCRAAGAVAVLVSATPSLETRFAADRGRLERLRLTQRVGIGRLPEGILVDLRTERRVGRPGEVVFSERLLAELRDAIAAGDQAILLRNRRGYAPMLLCRSCGEDFRCPDCGLARTFHRRARRLICHYCGSSLAVPAACPACRAEALDPIGAGTERVEEELAALLPGVAIDVLDRDSTRRVGGAAAILERFGRGDTRILIGTQMLSKGHHFPRVALTGVLDADGYLGFPDFRAVERTYVLLTQLAGRAGRGERPGRVVLQTYRPEHYAIRAALEHDDGAFAAQEMRFREIFGYPPFVRLALVLARDRRRERALERLRRASDRIRDASGGELRVTGPAPAPFERLRGEWRFQCLVRGRSGSRVRAAVAAALAETAPGELVVDVDPYQLL